MAGTDDAEAADPDWLRRAGFGDDGEYPGWLSIRGQVADLSTTLTTMPDDGTWEVEQEGSRQIDSVVLPPQHTRGDVRRVCWVLGIPLTA